MKIFPRRKKKADKSQQMFGQLSLEKFKALLVAYYKQNCALKDENSYFEPQDTLFGEMFDNAVRIKFLKEENKHLEGQYDDTELMNQAMAQYEEDKKKLRTGNE